jgi:hypothetical protein
MDQSGACSGGSCAFTSARFPPSFAKAAAPIKIDAKREVPQPTKSKRGGWGRVEKNQKKWEE